MNIFEKIKYLQNIEDLIIVEGKKDRMVLASLGLDNILCISGKSNHEVIDILSSRTPHSVLILTDYDREGEERAKSLAKLFEKNHIKTNSLLRKKVKSIFRINKIEELKNLTKLSDIAPALSLYDKLISKRTREKRIRKSTHG